MPHEHKSPLQKANSLVIAGLTLMEDRAYDKALSCLDAALGYTADLWSMKAHILHEMKKYDGALKCHETALKLDPKHGDSKMGKGVALHYLGKYSEALAVYDAIIAEDAKCAHAWFNKACAYAMMQKDDETFECLRKAFAMDPGNTNIHIATEESFDRLRKTRRFEKLLAEFRGKDENGTNASQETSYIQ